MPRLNQITAADSIKIGNLRALVQNMSSVLEIFFSLVEECGLIDKQVREQSGLPDITKVIDDYTKIVRYISIN